MDGRLFVIGFQGGTAADVNLSCKLAKALTVQAAGLRGRSPENKAAIVAKVGRNVWQAIEAGKVIFYEQDWNPQVDKQALQRSHRIGQLNHVLSMNLVTQHTIEEAIMRRAERKLHLSNSIMGPEVDYNFWD